MYTVGMYVRTYVYDLHVALYFVNDEATAFYFFCVRRLSISLLEIAGVLPFTV